MKAWKAWLLFTLFAALTAFAEDAVSIAMPNGIYADPDPAAKYFAVPPAGRAQFRDKLDTALQGRPKDPVLLAHRAYLLQQDGNLTESARDFSKALLYAEPGSATERNILWSLGWARYDQGEYEDALAAWRRAISGHGGKPYWQAYTLALLYWTTGHKDTALAWYGAAVAANAMWGNEAGFSDKTRYWRAAQRERMRELFRTWAENVSRAPTRKHAEQPSALPDGRLTTTPVEGASVGEWTARWWRWALTQPVEPFMDPDGHLCQLGQKGPVWFLAGTDGRFRPKRECEIPEGKYLLVPVINMIHWQRGSVDSRSPCDKLQASVAVNNDRLRSAVALLDDKPVGDVRLFRVKSEGCFPMDPDDPQSPLGAADGYWLMIKPLPSGRHSLVVGANYNEANVPYGGMNQNFEYVLHVGGKTTLSNAKRSKSLSSIAIR